MTRAIPRALAHAGPACPRWARIDARNDGPSYIELGTDGVILQPILLSVVKYPWVTKVLAQGAVCNAC